MKSKFTWIFTLLLAFFIQFAFAQEKTISGVVSDAQGLPIPGVNVTVEGVAGGVQTDFDGRYSIQAATGQRITFSMVGMAAQTVTVGASNTVSITLKEDTALLDEVVVVGYGVTTRERFTGTATKIDNRNLEAKTVSNVTQALRGEVAGVSVATTNGAPGENAIVRIRGFGTLNGNAAPLYVVDGAPYSSELSAINPSDIESVVILKDAAATSIYGTRGANGVILITTKQGRAGVSRISVDTRSSINLQLLPTYNTIESPEEYIEIEWSQLYQDARLRGEANPAAYANANIYGGNVGIDPGYNIWNVSGDQLIDPATGKFRQGVSRRFTPTKWSDAAFNTGFRQEANVQFSGGNDKTRYSTSFGYLDDQGYVVNSSFKRYTVRLNLEHKPKEWLKIGGNIGYTGTRYRNSSSDENSANSSGNIFALTNTTPAIYDVYLRDANGNLVPDPIFGGFQYDYGGGATPYTRRVWNLTNGIGDANYDLSQDDGMTLLGNFNLGIDLMEGLTFEMRYSGQYETFNSAQRQNPYYGSGASSQGFLSRATSVSTNQNFLQLLRYNKTFGSHGLEAFVAHESTEYRYKVLSAAAQRAILPNTLDLAQYTTPFGRGNSYTRGWTLDSYFAQLNYDYAQKYYLTGSIRRDGSSTFPNDPWGTFGSVGLGWTVSKENFMSGFEFVNFLKLKASYGVMGERAVTSAGQDTAGNSSLLYGVQISQINQTADGSVSFGVTSELANRNLTWETSHIAQAGIESEWFGNRLSLNVDYYIKNTTNLLFNQQLAPSSGFVFTRYNSGRLRNSGIEFDVKGEIIRAANPEDFSLSVGVNGEIYRNVIGDMPVDLTTNENKTYQDGVGGPYGWREGGSAFEYYMREWAGVDPATGAGLWTLHFNDLNNNGIYDTGENIVGNFHNFTVQNPNANIGTTTTDNYSQATEKFVGKSAIPKIRGAFRLNAGYKNFDFTALFGYSIGGYIYDSAYAELMSNPDAIGSTNYHTDIRNRWQQPGDITNVPRLSLANNSEQSYGFESTRWLTKADYFALNNVRLGYTVPQRFMENSGISMLNFSLSGDNLLMYSMRKGLNPQTTFDGSVNSGIYMPMTTFSLGVKVEF